MSENNERGTVPETAEETLTLPLRDVEALFILAGFMYGVANGNVDIRAALIGTALAVKISDAKGALDRLTKTLNIPDRPLDELNEENDRLGLPFRLQPRTLEVGVEIP